MAGGKGTRLWPEGRIGLPKQLLKITGDRTLIEVAVDRLSPLIPIERQLIVTTSDYAGMIAEALPHFPRENILAEPVGKNTAPCVGWAAVKIIEKDADAVMAVLTADHAITDEEAFRADLRAAITLAGEEPTVVTMGLVPTRPETGFGYIHHGTRSRQADGRTAYAVDEFKEKPDLETAKHYVEAGTYLWNSGMFVMQARYALELFERHLPTHFVQLSRIAKAIGTPAEGDVTASAYDAMHAVSIDYGIMENAESVYVIRGTFGWSDVGTWPSLLQINEANSDGNLVLGEHVGIDTKNCIIRSNSRLVATLGVENLVIIETRDAVLVCTKDQAQRVREVVQYLEANGRSDVL